MSSEQEFKDMHVLNNETNTLQKTFIETLINLTRLDKLNWSVSKFETDVFGNPKKKECVCHIHDYRIIRCCMGIRLDKGEDTPCVYIPKSAEFAESLRLYFERKKLKEGINILTGFIDKVQE